MKTIILPFSEAVADYAANEIISAISSFSPSEQKRFFVLGLPTGSTPEPVYWRLVDAYRQGLVSFKNVVSFNMDEYCGLSENHPQSYHFFMRKNLFDFVDMPAQQIHILDGMSSCPQEACLEYEAQITAMGGIDLQLGGIGENGHLAFNEPGTSFLSETHVQRLTPSTIQANSRFFEREDMVPTQALTIGLNTIFKAKKVLILATGIKKAPAIQMATKGFISEECPASLLQKHPNAFFVCDIAAGSLIDK